LIPLPAPDAGPRCARRLLALAAHWGLRDVDAPALWRAANRELSARLVLAAAREGLVESRNDGDALDVPSLGRLPLRRRFALELHAPALAGGDAAWLDDTATLWRRLAAVLACDAATTARIADELADGCDRLAHALLGAPHRRLRFAAEDPRAWDPEHFITLGHPWHPMVKTRLGLGWADNVRLAPELCARAALVTVEFDARRVRRFGDLDALARVGFDARGTTVRLPVLEAQWRRMAPGLRDTLRRVDAPRIAGRSLASLRTVALDGHGVHLKLAFDVLTTSAKRTVSPMSVANATVVSALVEQVQREDPRAAGSLTLMREVAAAGLAPEFAAPGLAPEFASEHARQLGVIVRDATGLDTTCIVCAALGEPDADGVLFVHRLAAGYPGDGPTRADAMFADYLAQLVPPMLRLWVAHGIALEGHMQNTVVRVDGGRPAGFLVRDLGGIRLHRARLGAAGHRVDLDPASFIITDDGDEAADKWVHAVVHAHLAGVLRVLVDAFDYDEGRGWARVAGVLEDCLDAWTVEPSLHAACEADRAHLFAPRVRGKALLRMRIADRSSEYSYVLLDNPLFAHRRRRES
jgi:siderophore synthetase component